MWRVCVFCGVVDIRIYTCLPKRFSIIIQQFWFDSCALFSNSRNTQMIDRNQKPARNLCNNGSISSATVLAIANNFNLGEIIYWQKNRVQSKWRNYCSFFFHYWFITMMNDERWTCEQSHQTKLRMTEKKFNRLKPVQHRGTSVWLSQNHYPPTAMSKIIPAFIFRLDFFFRFVHKFHLFALWGKQRKKRWRCIVEKCIRNAFRAQLIFI